MAGQTYGPIGHLVSQQTFWVFVAAVAAFIYLSLATTTFDTSSNLFNVARNFAFVGIIALGMTAVIITGGIDLSVGSVLCLSGMVTGMMMSCGISGMAGDTARAGGGARHRPRQRHPYRLCRDAALRGHARHDVAGAQPGDGAVAQSDGLSISATTTPSSWRSAAARRAAGFCGWRSGRGPTRRPARCSPGSRGIVSVPNPAVFLLLFALIFGFAFRWTKWGRHIFAIGGNEQAAELTGVKCGGSRSASICSPP